MKRRGYKFGVQWIADNDEPTLCDVEDLLGLPSLVLLADLFGKEPEIVARDVVRARTNAKGA